MARQVGGKGKTACGQPLHRCYSVLFPSRAASLALGTRQSGAILESPLQPLSLSLFMDTRGLHRLFFLLLFHIPRGGGVSDALCSSSRSAR